MKKSSKRVPVRYMRLLREILRESGVDTSQWLAAAQVSETSFNARDTLLTVQEMDALIGVARKLSERADFAFDLGLRIKLNSHDLLGYGLLSCSNMDEFMRMASRHFHHISETWNMAYRRLHSGGEVTYTPTVALPLESIRFYLEVFAVGLYSQVVSLKCVRVPKFEIYVSMPAPAHMYRYLGLAPARYVFHENAIPSVRVVMDGDLMKMPLPNGNPEVVRQIDDLCNAMGLRPARADVGWSDYVTMIQREARGQLVTLDDFAKRLNVSARTIDRHLKKEGLGFRELTEKVRFEKACELLHKDGATIIETALALGFSDVTNFSRAFRRVVGTTPGEYQRHGMPSDTKQN